MTRTRFAKADALRRDARVQIAAASGRLTLGFVAGGHGLYRTRWTR
jgi:hypothetical protein